MCPSLCTRRHLIGHIGRQRGRKAGEKGGQIIKGPENVVGGGVLYVSTYIKSPKLTTD